MTVPVAADTSSFDHFVERNGTSLSVNGEPYYFNGANAPWLSHTYPSKETVDDVMAFATDLGLDVLRTWLFSVGDPANEWEMLHQPAPGELGEDAFEHMDYVIQQAESHGIRLVFSLVDNWDYYGGMDQYVEWSPTASRHDDFYTDEYCKQWYQEYVQNVLTRENTLTGQRYKDDPTIMMWELANEAEARNAGTDVLHTWKQEMASYIKRIDPVHLLSTGSGGEYNTDSDRWHYSGANGVDYIRNHRIDEIDVCSFHLYPEWMEDDTKEMGERWIREHFVDAHEKIGKPAFLGEFGWARDRTPSRATVYTDWLAVVDGVDGTGVAPWQLIKEDRSETSKHDIRPSHTDTTAVLADFSTIQQTKHRSDEETSESTTDTSSLAGERLRVAGAGTDIWDRTDEFHFVHERVSGDASLTVNVASQENTDPWAKAGVMIRESLADDAAHAMIVVTPENGVAFQSRERSGDATSHTGASGETPQMLKLDRAGDVVTGYARADDTWIEVGSAAVPMAESHIGLAVTSHNKGVLSSVRFEDITGASDSRLSSWTNEDIGTVDVSGSVERIEAEGITVTVDQASDIGATTATLNGELLDLAGTDSATVYFEWGENDTGFSDMTDPQSLETPGVFTAELTDLGADTTYEFRAVAETDSERVVSDPVAFTTEADDETGTIAPTINRFALTDRSNPAWTRYRVDWAVSDENGDLREVTVEMRKANGSIVDSSTSSIGGTNAAGSDELRTKNHAEELKLTVTDETGNTASDTVQLSG